MADAPAPSQSRPRPSGLIGSFVALVSALADFFESRAALLATESKAALVQFLVAAVCLVAAVLFFAFGYIFLLATAVVAIAHMANVSWLWVALAAAGLHFVIALILLLVAGTGIKRPIFRGTMEELKKDREWLKDLETNQPGN
ncbi:MAG TPA: phage holin family protein [Chthoniobacterales bacterium]|nr:phage holin family protein [Chthoniobacterales bacterium]